MKTTRYFFLMLHIVLFAICAEAQQRNILQVPDINVQIGNAQLPISIENTDEIVGAQFDLTLPDGVTADPVGTLGNRSDGHSVTVSQLANGAYRVLLHSAQNRPLRGQSGVVMYLPINIPTSYEEGSEHALSITNALLGKATGENVLTDVMAGTIHVSKLPDLMVKNITFDKQALNPGDRLVVSWQVENIGELATNGGWSEQVSLISEDGSQSKLIATAHYDGVLDASGIVSRQVEVTLPALLGIDGQTRLQVRIVPDSNTGESASAQGNNIQTADGLIYINKVLTLELSPNRVVENSGARIMLKLNRSGNWTEAETFTVTATADSRITVPASVTIPAGQSGAIVYISLTDNDVLDDESTITVSAEGNGYAKVSQLLFIEDNEYPNLTVVASKSVLAEGETFQMTITASRASAAPLTVTLTSENSKRFTFPQTVTIPAGETSTTVTVETVDDELPSLELSNTFTASAPSYNKGELIVLLQDNDMPVLELTLTPNTVSEGVGPVAVAGVLRRTTNKNSKITVKLTDDANGDLYFGNRTLELAKGVQEVHFNFGPVDNAQVDGDRTYTITAAVWLSSCSCNASGESAGYVTAKLNVLDNDGPALTLSSSLSTVKEGDVTTLTISRNTTDTTTPLTVNISSDYDEALTYEHAVTIPAGQQSVDVNVASAANDSQGDGHTVVFTVQAEGYSTGTCYVMVTDQTLPDARITDFTTNVPEIEIGCSVDVSLVVVNSGAAPLPAGTNVTVYANSNTVGLKTSKVLGIGESEVLTTTLEMSNSIEEVRCYAVVNEKNSTPELNYNNNTSPSVVVKTLSPFTASVSTDKDIYQQGEKIVISGKITGNKTVNQNVEVYILYDGARMVQTTQTDANGTFSIEWMPYLSQSGHFVVGACCQGENLKEEMASFNVYGLKRGSNDYITCQAIVGEPYTGNMSFENPGVLNLTNVAVQLLSAPDYCDVQFNMPSTIKGGDKVALGYTINASTATSTNTWDQIKAKITTNEGVSLDILLYVFARNAVATLYPSTQKIKTTMVKGQSREYSMTITNTGKGNTGTISLSLPSWMTSVSGTTLASLNENETAIIGLKFTPNEEMYLNIPVTGSLAINCENGNGIVVDYDITPVSETTGTLIVDATDVYTYNTTEAPHVSGAKVEVRSPYTNVIVAQGETDENGLYTVDLPEGYYELRLSSDKHDSYSDNIIVDPGTENRVTAILKFEAITVNWSVTETEVEDEYDIVTTIKYETNVPMPVVVLDMPEKVDADQLGEGESFVFYATLTNKGLIAAQDAALVFPEYPGFTFEPLTQNTGLTIAPQQSVVIPVKLTRNSSAEARASRRALDVDLSISCGIGPVVFYYWDCGNDRQWHQYSVTLKMFIHCEFDGEIKDWTVPQIDIRIPELPPIEIPYVIKTKKIEEIEIGCGTKEYKGCEPCTVRKLFYLTKCLTKRVPIFRMVWEIIGWTDPVGNTYKKSRDKALDVLEERSNKLKPVWGWVKKIVGYKEIWEDCIKPQFEKCKNGNQKENAKMQRRASSQEEEEPSYFVAYQEDLRVLTSAYDAEIGRSIELFGDTVWINSDEQELSLFLDNFRNYVDGIISADDLFLSKPQAISNEKYEKFLARWNNTIEDIDSDNRIDFARFDDYGSQINYAIEYANERGYDSMAELYADSEKEVIERLQESSSSVCASISLQFKQTMTMTRQAFRGTLTVFNGHEDTAMQDVRLNLVVTNKLTGEVATSHEFQINAESLNGFAGELNLGSGWTLEANETGTATILFIPTKYAAPKEPIEWSFGGTLSYFDPFTGLEVTRELFPVTLTVKPSPELDLTYFMQRDIYGDDPLTEEVVEPIKPVEFALLINNKGYGDATNVRIVTQQPEIVDNEKGLAIKFDLISSQVNGDSSTLSFGNTIANDFGTIPAHSQAYAQWWLTSTLLGHFTDYQVEATNVTSYGNTDLSLLDTVTIHEMIHGFTVKNDGDKPLRGYLVNDIADADDMPDILYFTDATQQGVYLVKEQPQITRRSDTEYVLTVKAYNAGWNYGSVFDPTNGRQKLVKVIRGDGTEVNVDNVWQTDRTLRDGRDWLYENRLHFVGNMPAEGETFYLTFEPKPELELAVESYAGVPEENTVLKELLTAVTVKFNKPIKADSFTTADITLNCQGEPQDVTKIVIEKVNELEYKLTLNETTLHDGYYVLTVQTAGIEDTEGFNGATGKQVSWIQYVDGMVALKVTASPVEGGTVTPTSGRFAYDSNVTLKATPAEGYDFVGWKEGDATISTDREIAYHLVSATELKALFSIKHYNVTIGYDPTQGTVEGAATGIYEHGTQLQLTAVPATDYEFDAWMIGDDRETQESSFILTVNRNMDVSALFKEKKDVPTCLQNIDGDALRINIEPLPLSNYMYITGNFKEIRNVFIYDIRGIKVLGEGNVQSGQGIYVGKLNQGIYYMRIATDRGVYRTKVLKK